MSLLGIVANVFITTLTYHFSEDYSRKILKLNPATPKSGLMPG
jgi:hypothetical protein